MKGLQFANPPLILVFTGHNSGGQKKVEKSAQKVPDLRRY